MNILMISYDLGIPETSEDYKTVIDYIKSHDSWAKPLKSQWLIKTSKSVSAVRDELQSMTDQNDRILVMNVTGDNWATSRIPSDITKWMKDNL